MWRREEASVNTAWKGNIYVTTMFNNVKGKDQKGNIIDAERKRTENGIGTERKWNGNGTETESKQNDNKMEKK